MAAFATVSGGGADVGRRGRVTVPEGANVCREVETVMAAKLMPDVFTCVTFMLHFRDSPLLPGGEAGRGFEGP